jgi:arabinofuranosyltransferase
LKDSSPIPFSPVLRHIPFLLLLPIALLLSWRNRWIQDDAYISLVYARNLAEGAGLTWSGEVIQGFSNPLWVFLAAPGYLLPVDPLLYLAVLELALFAMLLVVLYRLGLLLFEKPLVALMPVALQLINFSSFKYSSGGLEANLLALLGLLLLVSVIRFYRSGERREVVIYSIFAFLAPLTHPTAGLPVVLLTLILLGIALHKGVFRQAVVSLIPGGMLSICWLLFAHLYFGSIFPNTYLAKMSSITHHDVGLGQILFFFENYAYHWIFLLGFYGLWIRRPPLWSLLVLLLLIGWFGVVVSVGGDFMEFRILIPAIPLIHLLVTFVTLRFGELRYLPFPLAAVLVCSAASYFSWQHATTNVNVLANKTMDGFKMLETFYNTYPDRDFSLVGRALGHYFAPKKPLMSTTAAGAIPYYSRLPTVDSWGLNDRVVAVSGAEVPASYKRPGHRRRAQLSYLIERGVGVVVEHPLVVNSSNWQANRAVVEHWLRLIPGYLDWRSAGNRALLVSLPLDDGRFLIVWLLDRQLLEAERMEWFEFVWSLSDFG